MVCDKCGTKIDEREKNCANCGAEAKQQNKGIIKPVLLIGLIVIISILCIILKYMAIIPISIIVIAFITIVVNRKILKLKNSKKNNVQVEEQKFSDKEIDKLSGYFVNRNEKYLSSLGNGYIMNFLSNKGLKRGFAIISDKRVYFRGSCFSGQGKGLKKTDEERTVDIRDITGSGFVYQRYIGILLALFVACLTLLGSVVGAGIGAWYSGQETYDAQKKEKEAADTYETAKNADKLISKLKEDLSVMLEKESELVALRDQDVQKYFDDKIGNSQILINTEVNAAYEEYLRKCDEVFQDSVTYECMKVLENAAYSYREVSDFIGLDVPYSHSPNFDGNLIYEYNYSRIDDRKWMNLNMDLVGHLCGIYGYDYRFFKLAVECYVTCLEYGIPHNEDSIRTIIQEETKPYTELCWSPYDCSGRLMDGYFCLESNYPNWMQYGVDDDAEEKLNQHYINFINKFMPDYTLEDINAEVVLTVEDLEKNYLSNNLDGLNYESEYDSELQQVQADIAQMKEEMTRISELSEDVDKYEHKYNDKKRECFGYYMLTTLATAGVAAFATFLISCCGIFFDYLSKRKTLFEIQYAGGRIAFDVSFYAKAEIEDFQKQLRRAKDFSQETANVRTVTVEAPTQASTQSSVPDELRKYADLLKDGLISQEEYDAMKKKILGL